MGLAAIFLMGVHSAIFGPSKYGLLPELLPEKRLSWGNGILELGTFLAIILGMMAGGELFDASRGVRRGPARCWSVLAVVGLAFSLGHHPGAGGGPDAGSSAPISWATSGSRSK